MKKLFTLIVAVLAPLGLMALPLGNPIEPSLLTKGVFSCCLYPFQGDPGLWDVWGLKIGYYGDFVWNRHMHFTDLEDRPRSKREIQIETDAACIALNFWNRLDLFCTLGGTEIFLIRPNGVFNQGGIANERVALTTNTDFAWSGGLRATLWECRCFGLGAEVQYAHARPQFFSMRIEDFIPFDLKPLRAHIDYHEWQVGVGAAYRINMPWRGVSLVPYAGVKWAHAVMRVDRPILNLTSTLSYQLSDYENEKDFGGVVGFTLVGCQRASLGLEGRFLDEKALHIDFHFRF